MDINTFGAVSMCKTFLPLLRESEGRIVNVCSVAGRIGVGTLQVQERVQYTITARTAFSFVLPYDIRLTPR